jgi:prophage regulatory protein
MNRPTINAAPARPDREPASVAPRGRATTLAIAKRDGYASEVGRFLRLPDVMATTGLGRSTLYRMIADQTFPSQIRLTARCIGWWEADVAKWLQDRRDGCPQV